MFIIGQAAQHDVEHPTPRVGSKKFVQQGPSIVGCVPSGTTVLYARIVHAVREPGKLGRTLLAAFFFNGHIISY